MKGLFFLMVLILSMLLANDQLIAASSVNRIKTNQYEVKKAVKKRSKRKKKKVRRLENFYENTVALSIAGILLSVLSVVLLFGSSGSGVGIVFGFFGGLICFLAWKSDEDVYLPLIGAILGVIGFLGGIRKLFSLRD
ncbi:MAG: hypothetical protein AAFZ15_25230 [Bacteroidota bacterium]